MNTYRKQEGRKGVIVLTLREKQVLEFMEAGLSYKEIAGQLGISIHTVKTHTRLALARLGARTATQAVAIAIRQGYIDA
ncbi:hypothetical protein ES703_98006 [subsurface metagenome]